MWSLEISIGVFVAAAAAVALAGPRLAVLAETLARRTGLGQAVSGALFLGATTSLSGITTSVTAAAAGHPRLAIANAVGGIATQTLFLAIVDFRYKASNLEHAAASPTNIFQCGLLIGLLALVLLAMSGPPVSVLGVHPVTVLMFAGYALGVRIAIGTHREPMWRAKQTRFTQDERGSGGDSDRRGTARLWGEFALNAALIASAGWALARSGATLAQHTGLDETIVGGLLTAVTTSLPELVTALAAVRRGAVNLAVGDIVGGNAFDTLFAGAADVFYRDGSIYHALGPRPTFLVALTILMTSVLVLGMVRREPSGIANIGFESALIIALYVTGFAVLALW